MHNLFVLGCPRSGTSMVTGTLASGGYWTDEGYWGADEHNPMGYFESAEVQTINDLLLAPYLPSLTPLPQDGSYTEYTGQFLHPLPLDAELSADATLLQRMQASLDHIPYCIKDIRFCYTLDLWRPLLDNTRFICVFRDPIATAHSLLRYCKRTVQYHSVEMTIERGLALWFCYYTHLLRHCKNESEWLFVHYNQMFDPQTVERLATFSGATLGAAFPEQTLRRAVPAITYDTDIVDLYRELCERAGYR